MWHVNKLWQCVDFSQRSIIKSFKPNWAKQTTTWPLSIPSTILKTTTTTNHSNKSGNKWKKNAVSQNPEQRSKPSEKKCPALEKMLSGGKRLKRRYLAADYYVVCREFGHHSVRFASLRFYYVGAYELRVTLHFLSKRPAESSVIIWQKSQGAVHDYKLAYKWHGH